MCPDICHGNTWIKVPEGFEPPDSFELYELREMAHFLMLAVSPIRKCVPQSGFVSTSYFGHYANN